MDNPTPQATPQNPEIQPVNTTVTVHSPNPAPMDTASAPIATSLIPPAGPVQLDATAAPPTPAPKETFGQGFNRTANPTFTTDANGNIVSTEPRVRRSVGGVLGSILAGALRGAAAGMAAQPPEGAMGKGAAFSAAAKAADEDKIARIQRAKAVAQQNFENQQTARNNAIKQQMDLAQEALITQNMEFAKEEHPGIMRAKDLENQEHELQIRGGLESLEENGIKFKAAMADMGIDPISFSSEQDPAFQAQGRPLVQGAAKMIQNGNRGDSNGIDIYPTQELASHLLTKPETWYSYDGALDKDGVPVPTPHILTPDGKTTALDYMNAVLSGRAQLVRMQQQISAKMTMQQHKAAVEEAQANARKSTAAAELSEAQAKNIGAGLNLPDTFKLPDNALVMGPGELQTNLQTQGVQVPSDFNQLYAIGHYKGDLSDYSAYSRQGGVSPRAKAAQEVRTLVNPNFDEKTYPAIKRQVEDFADLRQGHTGGNLVAFNTAVSHLGQAAAASKKLANTDIRGWNAIAQNMAQYFGNADPVVFDTIRDALAGEIGKVFKGGAADIPEREQVEDVISKSASPDQLRGMINTFAKLMQSKSNALISQYYGWTGELPPNAIDAHTAEVYNSLGLNPFAGLPINASVSVGGTGNLNPNQPPKIMTATNPQTKAKIQSTDGGKTWQPIPANNPQ